MTPQHGEHTNTIYINTYRTFRHIYIYIYLKLYISRACFCFTLRLKRNPSAPAVMALFCLLSQNTPATFMRFAIVGGGRGRGYNNIQSGNRIGRVKSTERGITDWITTPTDKRQNLTPGAKGRIQPFGCIRPWLFSKVLDQTFDIRRQTFHETSRLFVYDKPNEIATASEENAKVIHVCIVFLTSGGHPMNNVHTDLHAPRYEATVPSPRSFHLRGP